MSADRRTEGSGDEGDVADAPLARYGGSDAVLTLADGEQVDLNAIPDPFTGALPEAGPLTALQMPGEDPDADARARIGRRLQALREDRGLSRQELAARAGLAVSRLTAVERGTAALGLSLIGSLVHALDAELSEIAYPDAPEVSMGSLVKVGETAGVPRPALERIGEVVGRRRFAVALERAFSWTAEGLASGAPRSPKLGASVAFNARQDLRPADDAPVLALARRMSELSVSLHEGDFRGLPADPAAIREAVLAFGEGRRSTHAGVTLDALLSWTWAAGVIVLPLTKAKDFGAAVWLVDDDPVIVLQDSRPFGAYWLFNLAHELAHLALGHVEQRGIVDVGDLEDRPTAAAQEQEANAFALELLLPGAEALVAEVRARTRDDAPRYFKFAVAGVAREHGVSAGVLGFVAAREMADVPADKDRWGSASNLARDEDPDGRVRVEAAFAGWIRPVGLDELDAALLRAVSSSA